MIGLILGKNKNTHPASKEMVFLCFGVVFYSLSTPFPISVGLVEALIGVLFVLAFWKGVIYVLVLRYKMFSLIFYCLLMLPLVISMIRSGDAVDILRDIIPLFYIFIPLFFFSMSRVNCKFVIDNFCMILALAGVVYALRELLSWYSLGGLGVGAFAKTETYMIQAPMVLFSGCYFLCLSTYFFSVRRFLTASICLSLGLIPVLGFYYAVLRAPMFLLFFAPISYFFILYRSSLALVLIILSFAVFWVGFDFLYYFEAFINKHETYGDNNKLAELYEILNQIVLQGDGLSTIFGKGWGGTWISPAVGSEVSYAHSLLSYAILKGGLLGLFFFLFFLIWGSHKLIFIFLSVRSDKLLLLVFVSVMPALFVNVFLESGYKTLDFGLILAVLVAIYSSIEKRVQVCESEY